MTTQVKFFCIGESRSFADKVEKLNDWLAENSDRIIVKDIKFQTYCTPNPDCYRECTDIMVIYEVKGSKGV